MHFLLFVFIGVFSLFALVRAISVIFQVSGNPLLLSICKVMRDTLLVCNKRVSPLPSFLDLCFSIYFLVTILEDQKVFGVSTPHACSILTL